MKRVKIGVRVLGDGEADVLQGSGLSWGENKKAKLVLEKQGRLDRSVDCALIVYQVTQEGRPMDLDACCFIHERLCNYKFNGTVVDLLLVMAEDEAAVAEDVAKLREQFEEVRVSKDVAAAVQRLAERVRDPSFVAHVGEGEDYSSGAPGQQKKKDCSIQ